MENLQAILGTGGIIGQELARALKAYTNEVRLVARSPKQVNGDDELLKADLLDAQATAKAVKGSKVVYLTVGLKYHLPSWQKYWPIIMDNVLAACREHQAKLVFFDNIYAYHPDSMGHITEEARKEPQSEKGKVRLAILKKLWQAHQQGEVTACVARSADFYGPGAGAVSVINAGVLEPILAGKAANWFGALDKKHSFTFTKDAGKATALLGNSEQSWGEEWHLPTASQPLTGQEYIDTLAALCGKKTKTRVAGSFILSILGLFNPTMKEFKEMLYQYDRDYIFVSNKFESTFGLKPTPYREGLKELVNESIQ